LTASSQQLRASRKILRGALDHAAICSNDPVCADHEPDDRSGDRAIHGAACHGCLLIGAAIFRDCDSSSGDGHNTQDC
jgi:hypothetical protein